MQASSYNCETYLEAVTIRAILLNRTMNFCFLYIPPDQLLSKADFEGLVNQLPEPFILTGDFKAHNSLWADSLSDARNYLIEQNLLNVGARFLNKERPTYYSTTHNTYLVIDLKICSATLLLRLDWEVV